MTLSAIFDAQGLGSTCMTASQHGVCLLSGHIFPFKRAGNPCCLTKQPAAGKTYGRLSLLCLSFDGKVDLQETAYSFLISVENQNFLNP